MSLKKSKTFISEVIFFSFIVPWGTWITISIFSSKEADAVTEANYIHIANTLREIKEDVKSIKKEK